MTQTPDPFSILIRSDIAGSVESFEGMKGMIPRLRKKLGSDPAYFRRVYLYTFAFARTEGQRSLGLELALAFWGLLLPHGLKGGALRSQDPGGDDLMKIDGGWTEEHTQLWYDFLTEKNIKGISKDTWAMARIISLQRLRIALTFSNANSSLFSYAVQTQILRCMTLMVRSLNPPCAPFT